MNPSSFVRTVIADPDSPGELLLDLGTEICEQLGWEPGDTINWKDNGNGTFTLTKATPNGSNTE